MSKKQALLAASVAGLVAAAGITFGQAAQAADEMGSAGGKVPCYGINKCKGAGDCGGKGHTCAGQNGCAGQGYIKLEKETCMKIKGGSLTPTESST